MSIKPSSEIVDSARCAFARNPRQSGVIALLGMMVLALSSRLIMNGPAAATASFAGRSVPSKVDAQADSPRFPVTSPVLEWQAKPKEPVSRNLFAIHLDSYPRAIESAQSTDAAQTVMINGQQMKEGESIGDLAVVKIEPGRVAIRLNGELLEIARPWPQP